MVRSGARYLHVPTCPAAHSHRQAQVCRAVAAGTRAHVAVMKFQDLPLAGRERRWDADAAEKRVREWAGAGDSPNDRYRCAFVCYDADNAEHFGGHKLPIADVVGGKLKAVPRAVISAAGIMNGARGGADIPAKDRRAIKGHLARYYAKMDDAPPWEKGAGKP